MLRTAFPFKPFLPKLARRSVSWLPSRSSSAQLKEPSPLLVVPMLVQQR